MDIVTLIAPTPNEWRERFAHHAIALRIILPNAKIEHIGSTSLGFIYAKDVVDIMIGVAQSEIIPSIRILAQNGYISEGNTPTHAWLCWPDISYRKIIVHIVEYQGRKWLDRMLFRDYILEHRNVATEYEALKSSLAANSPTWTDYTNKKATFVSFVVRMARSEKE